MAAVTPEDATRMIQLLDKDGDSQVAPSAFCNVTSA